MTPYRDPAIPRSVVTRTPARTRLLIAGVVLLAMACAALTLTAALGWAGEPFLVGMGAMFCGAGAVGVLFGNVLAGAGEAPCPACGARLRDIPRKGRVKGILCPHCGRFLRSKAGAIRQMDPDTVADEPLFGAVLPGQVAWPPGCVVCGEEATQDIPAPIETELAESALLSAVGIAMTAAVGTGFLVLSGKRVTLSVPHCAAHDDGASLAEGGPTGLLVLFRSWPYQRAFCELNRVSAAESPGIGRSVGDAQIERR